MFAPIARLIRQRQQQQQFELAVHNSGLSEQELVTGEEALQLLQLTDHLEELQRDECLDFLFAVGLNPTLDVLESKLRQLKLHTHTHFTWGELAHVWKLLLAESVNEEQILEQAFMFFDRDANKEISIAELTTTMKELGDLLTAEEISTFVSIMDKNADGVVGYQEFLHCLRDELPVLAHPCPVLAACSQVQRSKQAATPRAAGQEQPQYSWHTADAAGQSAKPQV